MVTDGMAQGEDGLRQKVKGSEAPMFGSRRGGGVPLSLSPALSRAQGSRGSGPVPGRVGNAYQRPGRPLTLQLTRRAGVSAGPVFLLSSWP